MLYYRICAGEGGWWNLVCFPLVLVYHGTMIYAFGCIRVLASRFYRFLAYPILCCCWVYTDETFTGDAALGKATARGEIEWIRAAELRQRIEAKAVAEGWETHAKTMSSKSVMPATTLEAARLPGLRGGGGGALVALAAESLLGVLEALALLRAAAAASSMMMQPSTMGMAAVRHAPERAKAVAARSRAQ